MGRRMSQGNEKNGKMDIRNFMKRTGKSCLQIELSLNMALVLGVWYPMKALRLGLCAKKIRPSVSLRFP